MRIIHLSEVTQFCYNFFRTQYRVHCKLFARLTFPVRRVFLGNLLYFLIYPFEFSKRRMEYGFDQLMLFCD